jgi:hypothetical protein
VLHDWEKKWIPYSFLPEEEKEKDRIWARVVLDIIDEYDER